MKKILVVASHYPPSNLAAVHRSRLFAQHLPSFGWEPIILTVDERDYEEALDWNLFRLLPVGQRIEKVRAYPVTTPRLIGDIGLRAFFQLRRKAVALIREEKIDFVYIPIPSFYTALLGPYLQRKTGVRYGLDYIDPWVHQFPGAEKTLSRHWWSTKIARYLEAIAVRKSSLITGVAEGYYKGVLERNPALAKTCVFGAMPYGGEISDHTKMREMALTPYLFQKKQGFVQLVYAGAMLPKAYQPLEQIFEAIRKNSECFTNVEFHFIGTGKSPNDKKGYNIKPLAEKYGLWQRIIFEYPARIPYLDVLAHLEASSGIFILGSTEPHYTPSKVYQAILSGKPILAILHEKSAALASLRRVGGSITVGIDPNKLANLHQEFCSDFKRYQTFLHSFSEYDVHLELLGEYSAFAVAEKLSALLEQAAKQRTGKLSAARA